MAEIGITLSEFRDRLKTQADVLGSVRALATEIGVSASFLWNVINGVKNPGPKVLDFMGYEQVSTPMRLRAKSPEAK